MDLRQLGDGAHREVDRAALDPPLMSRPAVRRVDCVILPLAACGGSSIVCATRTRRSSSRSSSSTSTAPRATRTRLDKIDILFTRLAEIPNHGHSLARERHEIERLVTAAAAAPAEPRLRLPDNEVTSCSRASRPEGGDPRLPRTSPSSSEAARSTGSVRSSGVSAHPTPSPLLPALLETTVAAKNRFRELWEDEGAAAPRRHQPGDGAAQQLANHPEMVTPDFRDALETFDLAHGKFNQRRQDENLRREDVLELRRTLNCILEQFDTPYPRADRPVAA